MYACLCFLVARNLMGMMNNCCYRVKVHPRQTNSERAGRAGQGGRLRTI